MRSRLPEGTASAAGEGIAAAVVMPGLFVLLWASGFIGARLAMPYVEPMTFLAIRFALVLALIVPAIVLLGRRFPRSPALLLHLSVSGLLVHVAYLGGVFASIERGLPAGLSALVIGLQPLLSALVAGWLLGERINARQWAGLVLGLAGVAIVLSERLNGAGLLAFDGFGPAALLLSVVALLGITAGTLYQKRFCGGMELLTGTAVQYAAALIVSLPIALAAETGRIRWNLELAIALAWSVFGLSIAAVFLLMLMIRRGAAYRVASLFYLVPPAAALMAYALFGERLGPVGLTGTVIVVLGVALAMAPRPAARALA